jgi:hypothetical protein
MLKALQLESHKRALNTLCHKTTVALLSSSPLHQQLGGLLALGHCETALQPEQSCGIKGKSSHTIHSETSLEDRPYSMITP